MIIDELKRNPKKFLPLVGAAVAVTVIIIVVASTFIGPPPPLVEEEPEPVYAVEVGDIRFTLEEVKDRGNVLEVSESRYPRSIREDMVTTERFIEVVIGVQNIGKENTQPGDWQIKGLIDDEERKFESSRQLESWTPLDSKCAEILKPGFTPVRCTKIYDVAKVANGLRVEVSAKKGGSGFIDLGI